MNRPTKTCGSAAGMATLKIRKRGLAPMVRGHVVIGRWHARHARPGEHGDGEGRGQRDQEGAGAAAGREEEEGERQPGGGRQRTDDAHHRMDPVADARRPAERHAGPEAHGGADDEAARQQPDGMQQAVAETGPVVGVDFDEGLRRGEEGQRQQVELGRQRSPRPRWRAPARPARARPGRCARSTPTAGRSPRR